MSHMSARDNAGLSRILDTVQETARSAGSGRGHSSSGRSRSPSGTITPSDLRDALKSSVRPSETAKDSHPNNSRSKETSPQSRAQRAAGQAAKSGKTSSETNSFYPNHPDISPTKSYPESGTKATDRQEESPPVEDSDPIPDSPKSSTSASSAESPAEERARGLVRDLAAKQKAEQEALEQQKKALEVQPVDQSPVLPKTVDHETRIDPAVPQATPVTGHFNIICLTAMGYNRLIDLLLKEANHYDQMGEAGQEFVKIMENMVYTFSQSSSRFTDLQGNPEVLLTIMDEDFTNVLGILLKAAYTGHPDPSVDYSASLPYAGT